ncbi:hypothetical protein D6D01_08735 [Aureobasidium pullulans]|uniref:C3H1-type domain-containing protein n=1 Tax=Aureobasidium pullulans TaxID=5580 RepID=A0A4S9K9Z8_AURPU|nr:hypothetical protein D6D01_08735 [Aureobasidium pullulans]
MSYHSEEIAIVPPTPCHNWPFGSCTSNGCNHTHHENLNPSMPSRKVIDYQVPNNLGGACERCLENATKCDKKECSSEPDDPCSECRWNGGPGCKCVFRSASYNDTLWRQMLTRHRFGHELVPPKDRESVISNGQELVPMHEVGIICGWKGASEEELLARDDMLPAVVRRHPRAYLVPPRRTIYRSTAEEYGYDLHHFES